MTIESKYNGKCTKCGGIIPTGTRCEWERGAGVRHVNCPEVQQAAAPAVSVEMGVFKKDGRIYVVKPNKAKTRVYAKEIVESPARMTEAGEVVDFEAVYRPGAIYRLTEADRWDLADAKDFLTKFARCIVCGRHLKAAKSVAGAIGPVCAKYFAHRHNGGAACNGHAIADVALEAHTLRPDAVREDEAAERAEFDRETAPALGAYWVDDSGRAHSEPEPGVC